MFQSVELSQTPGIMLEALRFVEKSRSDKNLNFVRVPQCVDELKGTDDGEMACSV